MHTHTHTYTHTPLGYRHASTRYEHCTHTYTHAHTRKQASKLTQHPYNTSSPPLGYLSGVRDYVHVMDLAEGHVVALDKVFNKAFKGYVAYNLGTGRGVSVLEIIEAFHR